MRRLIALASVIVFCGTCWGREVRPTVIATQPETSKQLSWVMEHNKRGSFEVCDRMGCRLLTGSLDLEQAHRFFWFYQATLAQIAQQELHPERDWSNPLTGTGIGRELAMNALLVNGIALPGLLVSHLLNTNTIFGVSVVVAAAAMLTRMYVKHKHSKAEGHTAAQLLPYAHQLEHFALMPATRQNAPVVLNSEEYDFLVKSLKLAYEIFLKAHLKPAPQSSRN